MADPFSPQEILGYLSGVLVATSLSMKKIRLLRIFNLLGAVGFVVYGSIIASYSVVAVNVYICIINTYYLIKLAKE